MNEQAPYSLLAALEDIKDKKTPPVHLWNPDVVKDIDMEIKANGDWFYMGTPIKRHRLVHLFASVLRKEPDGDYYLVTPVEKCRIRVEDAPFQAVLMDVRGEGEDQELSITTNLAEKVEIDADHELRFEFNSCSGESSQYVHIREGLDARLNRNVYYQMTDLLVEADLDGTTWLGIWSHRIFFPVIRKSELAEMSQ